MKTHLLALAGKARRQILLATRYSLLATAFALCANAASPFPALVNSKPGADTPSINLPNPIGGTFAVSLWFNTSDEENLTGTTWNSDRPMTLAVLGSKGPEQRLYIRLFKSKVLISGSADAGTAKNWTDATGTSTISANQWYSLILLKTPAQTRLYINGQLAITSTAYPDLDKLQTVTFGRAGSSRYFTGQIAAPIVFNDTLNDAQIGYLLKNPPKGVTLAPAPTKAAAPAAKLPELITSKPGADTPHTTLPQPLGNTFTLSLWFNTPDETSLTSTASWTNSIPMTLAVLGSKGPEQRLLLRLSRSNLLVSASINTGKNWTDVSAIHKISASKWYSLVLVKTPGQTRIYINGQLSTHNTTIPNLPDLQTITFARTGSNRYFTGQIAQPQILPDALTDEQVLQLVKNPPKNVPPVETETTTIPKSTFNKHPSLQTAPDALHPLIDQLHISATTLPLRPNQQFPDILVAPVHPNLFGARIALFKHTGELTKENLPVYDAGTSTTALGSSEYLALPIPGNNDGNSTIDLFFRGFNTPYGKENILHQTATISADGTLTPNPAQLITVDGVPFNKAFTSVAGWTLSDIDGDGIPDLLVAQSKPSPGLHYWPDDRGPFTSDNLPNTGKGRGYDIAGKWLGDERITILKWAKGLPRKNGTPTFTTPKIVRYQFPDYDLQWKAFSPGRSLTTAKINGTPTLIQTGDIDQILALPYEIKNGEIIVTKSLPLITGNSTTLQNTYFPTHITTLQNNNGTLTFILDGNPGRLAVLRGNTTGNFTECQPIQTKGGPIAADTLTTPIRIDWDNDGYPDIITGDSSGYLILWPGTKDPITYAAPINFTNNGTLIKHLANHNGSIQGPGEKRWGYLQPNAGDWDEDGQLEILANDITGTLTLYKKNNGSSTDLTPTVITRNGEPYRVAWRSRPAILPSKYNYGATTRPGIVHLDWDGDLAIAIPAKTGSTEISVVEKLKSADGKPINLCGPNGFWGRCEITVSDWNNDGKWHVIFGTNGPNPRFFTKESVQGATPFLLENIGTSTNPKFAPPRPIRLKDGSLLNFDVHTASAYPTDLDNDNKLDLIIGAEDGKIYYFKRPDLQ